MNYLRPIRKTIFLSSLLVISLFVLSCEEDEIPEILECEEISLAVTTSDSISYTFSLNESGILSDIVWTVDGDTVPSGTTEEIILQLASGSFDICITGTSIECQELLDFCATIDVSEPKEEEEEEEDCPEIEYSFSIEDENNYVFELEEEGVTSILWIVNDDTVSREGLTFEKSLEPGENKVCVIASFENCESGVEFCETLEVEEPEECPEVTFQTINIGNNIFQFELENENPIATDWKINGEIVSQEKFGFEKFFEPGEYEICVFSAFENCESEILYCETLVVEEICPMVRIATEVVASGSYAFSLDLANDAPDPIEVKWLVDGEVISEGETDYTESFEPGTYEVCVVADFYTCLDPIETCETITVEENEGFSCPDMFFSYQSGGDNEPNKFYFFADFEGIENLEWYGWVINGDQIEAEGTINEGDNMLEYTFNESGTYEVCILTETPECPTGAEFCKEIIID